jgi:fatty-acyl-CoA synthase
VTGAATVQEALFAAAERGEGEYVFHLEQGPLRLSCEELAERAQRGARRLLALGVRPGDPVGVLGPNRPEWVVWAFAVWIAGGVLVPVQKKLRVRDAAAFSEQLRMLLDAAGCRRVLVDPSLASLLPAGTAIPWEETGEESAEEPPPPDPGAAAVIQFTSGSTAAPRGALVRQAAVIAQMGVLDEMVRDGDACRTSVNWAPFFHDLGLFLNVLPSAVWGLTSHHLPTERFARDPAEWFRLAASQRASLTYGPSSAFGNALRALLARGERVDLGALELAVFAAEGVDPAIADRLLEARSALNLPPEALGSSYGMAEAVLGVAYSSPGSGLRPDRIALPALASEGVATPTDSGPSRTLYACGKPKMELRIVGPGGELAEREVGEIQLRGPSLMSAYMGPDAPDPFADGWLRTGDMGYVLDGELYVAGRIKDMVIAMGDNYYPEDFEWAAARVEGVRPGRVVSFSVPGTEDVVVLVEARGDAPAADLGAEVRDTVSDIVGISPSEVVVLPAGTVQKTTSGKLRRAAMREAYASGTLADLTPPPVTPVSG